jgi:hypothetical protein
MRPFLSESVRLITLLWQNRDTASVRPSKSRRLKRLSFDLPQSSAIMADDCGNKMEFSALFSNRDQTVMF